MQGSGLSLPRNLPFLTSFPLVLSFVTKPHRTHPVCGKSSFASGKVGEAPERTWLNSQSRILRHAASPPHPRATTHALPGPGACSLSLPPCVRAAGLQWGCFFSRQWDRWALDVVDSQNLFSERSLFRWRLDLRCPPAQCRLSDPLLISAEGTKRSAVA